MRRVLLIAYHYPPARGSSGLQRALKYSRYLRDHGWEPTVLTVATRAHRQTGMDQMSEIPPEIEVHRVFALDSARHLSFGGAYPGWLALPDRWVSWWLGGVPAGLRLIRRLGIDAIWSTYPIATAHLIGLTLARLTGRPWIADCRDSMTEENYPPDPRTRRVYRWLERRTVARAAAVVFTTPGTLRMYQERYPQLPPARLRVIANGYDEENFAAAESRVASTPRTGRRPLILLHSGLLYPSERDPRGFFGTLAELKRNGRIDSGSLRVVLRASGHDEQLAPLLKEYEIEDLVELAPSLGYESALAEMLSADALLLFQAANCNHQIPAKLYEYLRTGRPILALTDAAGDTAAALASAGINSIASLDQPAQIRDHLLRLLRQLATGEAAGATPEVASRYSRRAQAAELATLLDEVTAARQIAPLPR